MTHGRMGHGKVWCLPQVAMGIVWVASGRTWKDPLLPSDKRSQNLGILGYFGSIVAWFRVFLIMLRGEAMRISGEICGHM